MYTIERAFNDFGPHTTNIGYVGKTEVTILDNLYKASQLLHGRILVSASIPGGYKVYVEKIQLKDIILAYQSLVPYKLSNDLDPLIQSLRLIYQTGNTDVELGLDNRIIMQLITVNNAISTNLKCIWEGVVSLRLLSYSGFNKDVTIDGRQQTLDTMIGKFSDGELHLLREDINRAGQLSGIKAPRQAEMRDMISDLIFSRKDSYVTLHQLFHTTNVQRAVLRKFRTDILFCPSDRYRELDAGLNVNTLVTITKTGENLSMKPRGFKDGEFQLRNKGLTSIVINVAGSIGSGKYTLLPLQMIQVFGTSVTLKENEATSLDVTVWSDVREYSDSHGSIVSLAVSGKLRDDENLSHIFFQIIKPIMPYFSSFVRKIQTSESLRITISKMPSWVQAIFSNLRPGHIYSGWLLGDAGSSNDRILYIYMLTMMIPEFLLDPTFTFSDVSGTPPYIHEYGIYTQNLRRLYE